MDYQVKFITSNTGVSVAYQQSDHDSPSIYCSFMNNYAEDLANSKKGVVFYNEEFIYGMIGDPTLLPEADFKIFLETVMKEGSEMKYKSQNSISVDKKKKINNIYQFMIISKFNVNALNDHFAALKFTKL